MQVSGFAMGIRAFPSMKLHAFNLYRGIPANLTSATAKGMPRALASNQSCALVHSKSSRAALPHEPGNSDAGLSTPPGPTTLTVH